MPKQFVNNEKNRKRDDYSFANINLLGKCNANCFFCLGKDIETMLSKHDQTRTHFTMWDNFTKFLNQCRENKILKLYITGQNTDSLLYEHLDQLIKFLQKNHFCVGLRTNGYEAMKMLDTINLCDLSAGYSIHTLSPITSKMILGRRDIPEWDNILRETRNPRVSIVLNRCNQHELFQILQFLKDYPHIKYVQVRRVSTDTRMEALVPDMIAYEQVYSQVSNTFPKIGKLWGDADVFDIFGMEVVFWRTIKTTVNSLNYFTDGTISDLYFVVEGYKKYCGTIAKQVP